MIYYNKSKRLIWKRPMLLKLIELHLTVSLGVQEALRKLSLIG